MNLKEIDTLNLDSLVEFNCATTLSSLAETTSSSFAPTTSTLNSICSAIPGGTTSIIGGLGTTGTTTVPYTNPNVTTIGPFTAGGVISGGGATGTYVWPPPYPQNLKVGDFDVSTELDDDGRETLILSLGERKNCNYKMQLLPGIILYSNHGRPGFIQRFVFKLLFGIKWESTLAERFIKAL